MITQQLHSADITTADFEDSVEIRLPDENKGLKKFNKNSLEMEVTEVKKSVVYEVFSKSCAIRNVTVFRDQAEINRSINVSVKVGDVEVVMRELPYVVDRDSVRVTCSNEAAMIVEVAFKTKHIAESNMDENEEKQKADDESKKISKRLVALKKEQFVLSEKLKRNDKELSLIESYASCISEKKGDKIGEILEKKNVESMLNFLSIYKDRSEKITDSNMLLNENLDLVNNEIDILTNNLNRIQPLPRNFKEENYLSVLLDVKKDCTIDLVVSYVVRSCASWTACYDVRAFSNDNTVQILYFANIQQSTGEDWNDCKISLSTALPSIGGSPPELQPQLLNIELPKKIIRSVNAPGSSATSYDAMPLTFMKRILPKEEYLSEIEESYLPSAEASEGMTSTSFEITRLATIPSDNNEHKVSICQLVFSPQFEYMAIPKSVAHAFLKLKVKNDSMYALLSGFANVFLDNNYLTRSCLPAVSPMEEFEIALGVDPAVKVTYKPLRKFQLTSGVISKFQVYDFHQQIEVKNTKRDAIKIKITDQCPRSTNDKIKVTLQEPDIKIPKSLSSSEPSVINHNNASLNTSDFKIEWLLELASNETKIINLRYQVEHPVEVIVRGLNVK